MNRPYTICYLNCSADGQIDGEFMRSQEAKIPTDIFRERWLEMEADCTIYGAVTMAQFADGWLKDKTPVPKAKECYPRTDFVAPCDAEKYYLAINTRGTVAYSSRYIDRKGRGRHGVIHVLTEDISDDYIAYLRALGISYIFCGKEKLDPVLMMEKAYALFGIRKAIISGGAYADWTLLSEGLIDEVTMLFNPVVDGNPDAHQVFLRSEGMPAKPVGFKLVRTEVTNGDGLLCSLVKEGIENARPRVPVPVIVYDDAAAERAVEVTPDQGKIAVIAMKKMPLPLATSAVESAAQRAGKTVRIEQIVVETAANCLSETRDQKLADAYFIRYLREHQGDYAAYVVPQVPLSRIMPQVRDMKTPVFDSMEPLLDKLVNTAWSGFEAAFVKRGMAVYGIQ